MQDNLDKKHTERKLSLERLTKFVQDVIIEKPGFTGSVRVNFFDGIAKDAEKVEKRILA